MAIREPIVLDLNKPMQYVNVRIQKGDAFEREVDVTITANNEIYEIPSGSLVSLKMARKGAKPIYNSCQILSDGNVRFIITPEISSVPGRHPAKIEITNSATGGIISTIKFHMFIEEDEDLTDEMITVTGEFTALQDAMLRVTNVEAEYIPRLDYNETKIQQVESVKADKTEVETVKSQLQQRATKQEVGVVEARVETILALPNEATINDARLEDIKVAYDGTVYNSPGEGNRKQFQHINERAHKIERGYALQPEAIKYSKVDFMRKTNHVDEKHVINGYYYRITGEKVSGASESGYDAYIEIPVKYNKIYARTEHANKNVIFFDSDNIFTGYRLRSTNRVFIPPINSDHMMLNLTQSTINRACLIERDIETVNLISQGVVDTTGYYQSSTGNFVAGTSATGINSNIRISCSGLTSVLTNFHYPANIRVLFYNSDVVFNSITYISALTESQTSEGEFTIPSNARTMIIGAKQANISKLIMITTPIISPTYEKPSFDIVAKKSLECEGAINKPSISGITGQILIRGETDDTTSWVNPEDILSSITDPISDTYSTADLINDVAGNAFASISTLPNGETCVKFTGTTSTNRVFTKRLKCKFGSSLQFDLIAKCNNNSVDIARSAVFVEWVDKDGNYIYSSNKFNCYLTAVDRFSHHRFRFPVPMGAVEVDIIIMIRGNSTTFGNTCEFTRFEVSKIYNPAKNILYKGINFCAHLGMIAYAPRNTMEAFELASIAGFNSFVTNSNITSDGILVALHDDTIDATSNGTGAINSMTYEQASQYDYGSWFGAAYTGAKLPKLEEVIAFASMSGMHPYIRLNSAWTNNSTGVYTQILAMLTKYGLLGNATVKAFNTNALDACYAVLGNKVRYGFCTSSVSYTDTQMETYSTRYGEGNFFFDVEQTSGITESFVQRAHAKNILVSAWIVNDFNAARNLMRMGVTEFCTDTLCDPIFPI